MVQNKVWGGTVPKFSLPLLMAAHLPELQEVNISDGVLSIGAGCTLANILNHPMIPYYVKIPISYMASPAIRNMATIGGNICNSSPAGDTLPMLYALDAELILKSCTQVHTVKIADFIAGPRQNLLQDDEILCYITIPLHDYKHFFYKKVGSRHSNSISKVSFYGVADGDADKLYDVKMSLGAVGKTVIRSEKAETLLKGVNKSQIPQYWEAVRDYFIDLIEPIDDIRSSKVYRQTIAIKLLKYFLTEEI
jgi:CO/xanthine dehydrogenase FAD-binding subunit